MYSVIEDDEDEEDTTGDKQKARKDSRHSRTQQPQQPAGGGQPGGTQPGGDELQTADKVDNRTATDEAQQQTRTGDDQQGTDKESPKLIAQSEKADDKPEIAGKDETTHDAQHADQGPQ